MYLYGIRKTASSVTAVHMYVHMQQSVRLPWQKLKLLRHQLLWIWLVWKNTNLLSQFPLWIVPDVVPVLTFARQERCKSTGYGKHGSKCCISEILRLCSNSAGEKKMLSQKFQRKYSKKDLSSNSHCLSSQELVPDVERLHTLNLSHSYSVTECTSLMQQDVLLSGVTHLRLHLTQ